MSRSASAPDVVDSFVDMSSESVQETNEARLPCIPLYPLSWRLATAQGRQRTMCSTAALDGIDRNQVSAESWRSSSLFDSSRRGCSVDAITGIDLLSCRRNSSWAGEYPHFSDVVQYANSAPYGSTDFFSIALTVCTVRSALPLH